MLSMADNAVLGNEMATIIAEGRQPYTYGLAEVGKPPFGVEWFLCTCISECRQLSVEMACYLSVVTTYSWPCYQPLNSWGHASGAFDPCLSFVPKAAIGDRRWLSCSGDAGIHVPDLASHSRPDSRVRSGAMMVASTELVCSGRFQIKYCVLETDIRLQDIGRHKWCSELLST